MLRRHEELLLNWFRAKGDLSAGAVEGLNNKIRVVTRRSYGFRTYEAMARGLHWSRRNARTRWVTERLASRWRWPRERDGIK